MRRELVALLAALAALAVLLLLWRFARHWAGELHRAREHTVRAQLSELFLVLDTARVARWCALWVLCAVGTCLAFTGSGLWAAAVGVGALAAPLLLLRTLRRRRRERLLEQLPDALDLLASALQSGLGLQPALQHAATHQPQPLGDEFALVLRKQRLGVPLDRALAEWRERIGGAEAALFVTALGVGRQLGGNLSGVLQRLAATLREKAQIERKIDALTAQGRLQARIVGALPLLLIAIMHWMEPRAMHMLYTTTTGQAVLAVLIALEAAGFLLLRRVLQINV